ncbi:MAG: YCF48-related protein [Chlamydiota bacterium]
MSELPKFVLQRLAATAAPAEHPGADLLAAFAEQNLSDAEREKLLTHLGTCAQCREVVWLALPEMEAEQLVVGAARPKWFPVWRWVGVAAVVAVVATVALVYRGGPGPAGEEVASAPQPPAIAQQRDTQALKSKDAAPAPAAEARLDARNAPARVAPQSRMEAKVATPKIATATGEQVAANEVASGTLAKSDAQSADRVASLQAAAPVPNHAALPGPPLAASTDEAGVMIASNIPARSMGKKKLAPPTRWMLSGEGALLRSTDAGNNWQSVPFNSSDVFRAVAVVGPRVWVGGRGGALYFSADDGSQWTRLSPAAAGVLLNDDISKLAFHDGQHGSLTTAAGQVWITSDGGRSWQKQ